MNYTTQHASSPYQIRTGEAFSAYALRMDDAIGGSFLADYASAHPDVVDFLGTVESGALADAMGDELTVEDWDRVTDSPDFETVLGDWYDEDDYELREHALRMAIAEAADDCMTRADWLGLCETRVPGVLARVAARLRGA